MIHKTFGLFAAIAAASPAAAAIDQQGVTDPLDGRLLRTKIIIERAEASISPQDPSEHGVGRLKLAWTVRGGTWSNWLNWNNLVNPRR